MVDLKTLGLVSKVPTGGNPDAIMFEPDRKEIYTFNGSGKSATVIEAATGKIADTIDLGGKPEAAAEGRAGHRIFVNLGDVGAIAVIDTGAHARVATWPLSGCEEPTGLHTTPHIVVW